MNTEWECVKGVDCVDLITLLEADSYTEFYCPFCGYIFNHDWCTWGGGKRIVLGGDSLFINGLSRHILDVCNASGPIVEYYRMLFKLNVLSESIIYEYKGSSTTI